MKKYSAIAVALLAATFFFAWQSGLVHGVPPSRPAQADSPPGFSADALQRDLLAYFRGAGASDVTDIKWDLLRDQPTRSGTTHPKYYVWVRVYSGSRMRDEGAARVEAVDQARFEVTNYMSAALLQEAPDNARSVFPAALVPDILKRAGAT